MEKIDIFISVCYIITLFNLLFMYRTHWIAKKRLKIMNDSLREFKKLESFDKMQWKFWIWDVEKFKGS